MAEHLANDIKTKRQISTYRDAHLGAFPVLKSTYTEHSSALLSIIQQPSHPSGRNATLLFATVKKSFRDFLVIMRTLEHRLRVGQQEAGDAKEPAEATLYHHKNITFTPPHRSAFLT